MIEQVLRLIFPPALRNNPLIKQLIRTYHDLTVNILLAQVNSAESWLEIQIVGRAAEIESAIVWLKAQGIEVQTLGA